MKFLWAGGILYFIIGLILIQVGHTYDIGPVTIIFALGLMGWKVATMYKDQPPEE